MSRLSSSAISAVCASSHGVGCACSRGHVIILRTSINLLTVYQCYIASLAVRTSHVDLGPAPLGLPSSVLVFCGYPGLVPVPLGAKVFTAYRYTNSYSIIYYERSNPHAAKSIAPAVLPAPAVCFARRHPASACPSRARLLGIYLPRQRIVARRLRLTRLSEQLVRRDVREPS